MFIKNEERYFRFFDEQGQQPPEVKKEDPPTPKSYSEDEFKLAIENERKREQDKNKQLSQQLEELKKAAGKSEILEKQIKDLQESLMTKDELAKKKLEEKERDAKNQLETITKDRDSWQNRFQKTLIQREILDAASKEGAFDPGIFINLLRENTNTSPVLDNEGNPTDFFKVVIKLDHTDKSGKPTTLSLTPEEAIKHLKGQPEKYGYLFKGVGTPGAGLRSDKSKFDSKDLENMSLEDYKKHRDQIMGKKS